MFVGGHSPEEVWILVLEAGVDRALGAVGDHHGAVVLAHPGDGLHSVGAGRSWPHKTHLSPRISLISDLVHDGGMLQSELFTSRSQNLVLAKLPNSGFWRYGQFFK